MPEKVSFHSNARTCFLEHQCPELFLLTAMPELVPLASMPENVPFNSNTQTCFLEHQCPKMFILTAMPELVPLASMPENVSFNSNTRSHEHVSFCINARKYFL
jgi:hypothetical protein